MSKESRRKLASLSFTEKVKLLEKLRQRSLAFAEARRALKEKSAATNQDHTKDSAAGPKS